MFFYFLLNTDTNKEVIFESCSDDNDENIPNENLDSEKRLKTSNGESAINSEIKKKVLTSENDSVKNRNTKVKQSSIKNFFKKS